MIKLTTDKNELKTYLQGRGWLKENEGVQSVEEPGQGNMNFTLRINTGVHTFIIKQSRDYVEKYPQVAAPADRVLREGEFYNLISGKPALKVMMPEILGIDEENNVIIMDDLGAGADYTHVYREGRFIPEAELLEITDFAAKLHNSFSALTAPLVIRNRKMRKLNHEHIFIYPYADDNGLNLDDILPGLQAVSKPFKSDEALKTEVQKMGEHYLADGDKLLHGDYFPGSWLKTKAGIRIIDPEFCFFGSPEFEMGVMVAHLRMADQPNHLIEKVVKRYASQAEMDEGLRRKFTAIEVLRRIIGLAQLPLEIDLKKRKYLLEQARVDLLDTKFEEG